MGLETFCEQFWELNFNKNSQNPWRSAWLRVILISQDPVNKIVVWMRAFECSCRWRVGGGDGTGICWAFELNFSMQSCLIGGAAFLLGALIYNAWKTYQFFIWVTNKKNLFLVSFLALYTNNLLYKNRKSTRFKNQWGIIMTFIGEKFVSVSALYE